VIEFLFLVSNNFFPKTNHSMLILVPLNNGALYYFKDLKGETSRAYQCVVSSVWLPRGSTLLLHNSPNSQLND